MSIFAGFGAVPENLTVPLTLAAVAGSIGAAVGAAGGGADGCCSALSFLPHPVSSATASKADRLPIAIDFFVFIFISCLSVETSQNCSNQACYLGARCADPPTAALTPEELTSAEARVRPIDALTRRCSSGVSWKIYSTRSLLWSLSYPLNDGGVGPENVQRLFSRLNSPGGMEVPGLMACGSMIQRSTQSGFKRPLACRKLGAVAVLS